MEASLSRYQRKTMEKDCKGLLMPLNSCRCKTSAEGAAAWCSRNKKRGLFSDVKCLILEEETLPSGRNAVQKQKRRVRSDMTTHNNNPHMRRSTSDYSQHAHVTPRNGCRRRSKGRIHEFELASPTSSCADIDVD